MQWRPQRDLERIQLKRLKKIIKFAYNYVPYYHEILKSVGVKPEDINCLQDLKKIPLTTKKDVQSNYLKMLSIGVDYTKCAVNTTTGSTGRPLSVFYNDATDNYFCALWQYAFLESGLHFADKLADITASSGESYIPPRFSLKRARSRAYMKKADISIYNPLNEKIKLLERIKPDAIHTFPSILTLLAEYVKDTKYQKIRPKLIFTIAETVSQHCRKIVQDAFGVDVNDIYGSAEFERMAFECNEHLGLHILPDCILEFLSEGDPVNFGEEGEIIVTGLNNFVMPLIRYQIGDVGIPIDEHCSCGRTFPLIKQIIGRNDDFLVLPSGRLISPRNINAIENIPGIIQYQTIQYRTDRFLVKVVNNEEFEEKSLRQIEEIIQRGCYGEDIIVDVQIVDKIPRERTGKIRTIISKVSKVK
jgi:phenylacetate-CoA ligase